jgi:hypothetical protein
VGPQCWDQALLNFGDKNERRGNSKISLHIAFIIYLEKESSLMDKSVSEIHSSDTYTFVASFNAPENEKKRENIGTAFC